MACKAAHEFLMKNCYLNPDGRFQNPAENPGNYIQNRNYQEGLRQSLILFFAFVSGCL